MSRFFHKKFANVGCFYIVWEYFLFIIMSTNASNSTDSFCNFEPKREYLVPALQEVQEKKNARIFKKKTFGSVELAQYLADIHEKTPISSIELIGLCTDICVVSNALLIKAYLPEVPILVDASCCAGVTPGSHEAALQTMECCQIQVQNR